MADKKKAKRGTKDAGAKHKTGTGFDIDDLADRAGLKPWEKKAFFQAAGWAPGKQVSGQVFESALEKFERRPMGGGAI